jgi:2-polyprenyl-3-methyl-5-hydroxy-6-metoxy-1,4-benzoquinol methylase
MNDAISVGGSDTGSELNLTKRVSLIGEWVDLPKSRVLDAGCGAGAFVDAMAQRGADAHGIEYVEEKISERQARYPGDTKVQHGDVEALAFPDNDFDAVLLNEVLEHVPNDVKALAEVHRVTKPGGTLVIFSPNRFHPIETHGVYSRRTGEHLGQLRTLGVPYLPMSIGNRYLRYWSRNYWPSELMQMVRDAGFEIRYHGYVWQTFENISGSQPKWVGTMRVAMRRVAAVAERTPVARRLGVSQLIVATRR